MNRSKTGAVSPRSQRLVKSRTGSKSRNKRAIRVLLADDHPVVRWGMSCFLESHERLAVVGEASDGLEAIRKAKELQPDVVLMDIEMPELNGLAATEIIRREHPEIGVLLLSMHPYKGHISRILQCGAQGFLLKDSKPIEIVAALCKVADGETSFSPSMAGQVLHQFALAQNPDSEVKALSQREREVLIGIAEGFSNKSIAARLGISARTVETHRSHISRKLNIRSVAGLTRFAISRGFAELQKPKVQ